MTLKRTDSSSDNNPRQDLSELSSPVSPGQGHGSSSSPPEIPDHELLHRIGGGSYGEVWLARNVMGTYRAVKIIYRRAFEHERPFDREFDGIRKFEPCHQ